MHRMCGRYALYGPVSRHDRLQERLEKYFGFLKSVPPRYNISPDQGSPTRQAKPVPIIRQGTAGPEMALVQWWLLPPWSKERYIGYSTFNAKAETVATAASFREPFKRRRCLIPASGFYEWSVIPGERQKQPWFIHAVASDYLAFAGIWDRWQQGEQVVESCSVIVTEPNGVMRPIHNRMPVILAPDDFDTWLDPANHDVAGLKQLLRPCPDDVLSAYKVSRLVSGRNDRPDLIEPIENTV